MNWIWDAMLIVAGLGLFCLAMALIRVWVHGNRDDEYLPDWWEPPEI